MISVLIVSFILINQTSIGSPQAAAVQACYFPSVSDDAHSAKASIEIMNIMPVGKEKVKFTVYFVLPNETMIKSIDVYLTQYGRERLRVFTVLGKAFNGQVVILSNYEFVAEHTQCLLIGTDWEAWSVLQRSAPAPVLA